MAGFVARKLVEVPLRVVTVDFFLSTLRANRRARFDTVVAVEGRAGGRGRQGKGVAGAWQRQQGGGTAVAAAAAERRERRGARPRMA